VSGRTAALSLWVRRIANTLEEELTQLRPLDHALNVVARAIPLGVGGELRVLTVRARGIKVGEGTVVHGPPEFSGGESGAHGKMVIGSHCIIDIGCSFEMGETIVIGDHVTIGHDVMILTTTHELGPREHRAGTVVRSSVQIEDGAWIGPRSVILPGVTVGAGAIVDPGSVVNKNVAPNTRVRGTPARLAEELAP